jgi:hypothetical protein
MNGFSIQVKIVSIQKQDSKKRTKTIKTKQTITKKALDLLLLDNDLIAQVASEIGKDTVFVRKGGGGHYLNLIKPTIHADRDPMDFSDFPKDIRRAIYALWTKVKEVMCGGDEEQYEIAKKWLIYTIQGVKLHSFMYLFGPARSRKVISL